MELGQYQIQVFISLVVILCAACITVVCEFVKNRQDSQQQHIQARQATNVLSTSAPVTRAASAPPVAGASITQAASQPAAQPSNPVRRMRPKRPVAPEALAAMEKGKQRASEGSKTPPPRTLAPRIRESDRPFEPPPEVLAPAPISETLHRISEPLPRPPALPEVMVALTLAEEFAAAPVMPAAPPALAVEISAPVAIPAPVEEPVQSQPEPVAIAPEPAPKVPEPVIVNAEAVMEVSAAPAPVASAPKRNWGSVLQSSKEKQESRPLSMKEKAALSAKTPESMPTGFQDGLILSNLVQSRQPVSGLVVIIGVHSKSQIAVATVDSLVQSLLGSNDFAARVSEHEYLLIFPTDRGPFAEQRLAEVAGKLAELQSRTLANYEILFTCGGVEARAATLDQAMASVTPKIVTISPNLTLKAG